MDTMYKAPSEKALKTAVLPKMWSMDTAIQSMNMTH